MNKGQIHIEGLCVETAFVYDFTSHGELFPIDYVTMEHVREITDTSYIFLTKQNIDNRTYIALSNAAVVCFDVNQAVSCTYQVIDSVWRNTATSQIETPHLTEQAALLIAYEPELSIENAMMTDAEDLKDHLLKSFQPGDVVRFKVGVNYTELDKLSALIEKKLDDTCVSLSMLAKEYATVETDTFELNGTLVNQQINESYELQVSYGDGRQEHTKEMRTALSQDTFSVSVPLTLGANYIDCMILVNGEPVLDTKSTHIVFYKEASKQPKEIIMWAEEYVNANVTNSVEKIENLITTAKDAGITAFSVDVKGCEGYAAYKKTTLSHAKYMTASINPKKQITMDIDFLEEFIKAAHAKGLKVYTSINFFVEGNIASGDYAIDLPNTHRDWAEVLYVPEDHGELKSVLDTKRNCMLCYVNPANQEVQDFQLLRVKEILDNYEVDGIVMDRTRYDNQYADFSEATRTLFEKFLAEKGKNLTQWPQDIYTFDEENTMVFGPLYLDWLTFRSSVIQGFAKRLRGVVDEYKQAKHREIALAAYVGSWYDLYYQNGVNWASKDFHYNERLNFPVSKLYSEEYNKTSYLESIDFIMIGCYYETAEMIEKYSTIGNVVTNHQIPVMASLSLPHLSTEETLKVGANACLTYSDGTMIFDLCYTNWDSLKKALKA